MDALARRIMNMTQTEETLSDLFSIAVETEDMELNRWVRKEASQIKTLKAFDLVRKTYILGGRYSFDDYMIACEWNREPQARFYLPRRAVLEGKHKIVSQIQEFIDDPDALYLGFSMPPGTGKLISDDTPVLTRNGWKKHGDLVVGDEVIGMDGKFKKVTYVFPKHFANRRVWFGNGEHIDCHENHEWLVYDRGRNTRRNMVVETKEIESTFREGRYYVDRALYVFGDDKNLPVKPYSLGVWLGDGENRHPRIANGTGDEDLINGVVADGYALTHIVKSGDNCSFYTFKTLRKDLQKVGMCFSTETCSKRIPMEYFTASIKQRLELLAGLIDSDGCYVKEINRFMFTTKYDDLKKDFIRLVSTFGWRCNVYKRKHADGSETWGIQFNADLQIPCRLKRKRNMARKLRYSRYAITKIEKIEPKQGNCIQVEGGMYLVGETLIPTHNSTLIKFLLAYVAGKYPKSSNIYASYSDGMTKMIYDSVSLIMTDTAEYCHNEIFPGNGTPALSAEYKTISYRKKGDFPTLGLVSIGGSVTGRTRANKFLVSDDLVKDGEMARSPERLEKLYHDYKDTLTTRKIGDNVKEIQLGTIWSIHDPISRKKAEFEGDPRYRFIAIPVKDENGHSNFYYDHQDRYSDERIAELEKSLDPVSFSCLYMQRGIEREGLALPADELQYYNGVLPDGEPDNVLFVCDVAWGGGDSTSMPILYKYGDAGFVDDVLFDTGAKDVTKPRVVGKILQHKCKMGRFEANNGGDEYADSISKMLKDEHGYSCNITHKKAPTTQGKAARIEQYAPDIKRYYFRDRSCRSPEYNRFMDEMTGFSFTSKNLHDDAADSMAMLADYDTKGVKSVSATHRPF